MSLIKIKKKFATKIIQKFLPLDASYNESSNMLEFCTCNEENKETLPKFIDYLDIKLFDDGNHLFDMKTKISIKKALNLKIYTHKEVYSQIVSLVKKRSYKKAQKFAENSFYDGYKNSYFILGKLFYENLFLNDAIKMLDKVDKSNNDISDYEEASFILANIYMAKKQKQNTETQSLEYEDEKDGGSSNSLLKAFKYLNRIGANSKKYKELGSLKRRIILNMAGLQGFEDLINDCEMNVNDKTFVSLLIKLIQARQEIAELKLKNKK